MFIYKLYVAWCQIRFAITTFSRSDDLESKLQDEDIEVEYSLIYDQLRYKYYLYCLIFAYLTLFLGYFFEYQLDTHRFLVGVIIFGCYFFNSHPICRDVVLPFRNEKQGKAFIGRTSYEILEGYMVCLAIAITNLVFCF